MKIKYKIIIYTYVRIYYYKQVLSGIYVDKSERGANSSTRPAVPGGQWDEKSNNVDPWLTAVWGPQYIINELCIPAEVAASGCSMLVLLIMYCLLFCVCAYRPVLTYDAVLLPLPATHCIRCMEVVVCFLWLYSLKR